MTSVYHMLNSFLIDLALPEDCGHFIVPEDYLLSVSFFTASVSLLFGRIISK